MGQAATANAIVNAAASQGGDRAENFEVLDGGEKVGSLAVSQCLKDAVRGRVGKVLRRSLVEGDIQIAKIGPLAGPLQRQPAIARHIVARSGHRGGVGRLAAAKERHPVEQVTWGDCQFFLKKLTEKGGDVRGSYRLPTEAQWEYACRAGSTGVWFFGDSEFELDDYGWYEKNSEKKTHPVGEKKPNGWGLDDVYGNVWEWCADWFGQDYYKSSPGSDPTGPPSGSYRVSRGGGWHDR